MDDREKLFYFRRFFSGRDDVYAFRVPGEGYRPRRTPEYKLTDKMIIRHMAGEVMLGAYPIMSNGECNWIAADFDGNNGNAFDEAYKLVEALREYDITPLCNTSQSGKGVHVRVVFGDPKRSENQIGVKSYLARRFMNYFIDMSGVRTVKQGGAFDRLFPSQDRLETSRSIGNQIAMPFHLKAAQEREGTMLLDRQFKVVPLGEETWDEIELYEPLEVIDLLDLLLDLSIDIDEPKEEKSKEITESMKARLSGDDLMFMLTNCDFMTHAIFDFLSYDEWVFLAANLAAFDHLGGLDAFHKLSRVDPRYNQDAAEKKYNDILGKLSPTTCSRISEYWRCPQLGSDGQCNKFRYYRRGARAPAALPFIHSIANEGTALQWMG